jgi:Tol biopolymer transport system component
VTAGDPGPMAPGRQFGSYTIVSLVGAGGMGEVYRARDTKLGRDVALKVLPQVFAGNADRINRFEREALLLASLNHPNIAIIHGIEEADGVRALVLELIEGPTLADRIAQATGRALEIDEALTIARQIADALQVAHDHGVIHRDLKPANIKVRPDGTVKVLDFGLAKIAVDGGAGFQAGPNVSNSPTMMASMPGLLLGTAAYMSPEQAKGQEADRRADVWAFGCVLFEILTGCAAFEGTTTSEILAGVLKTDPDWSRLPAGTPDAIRRLLRRCLEKDDKRRLRDIADARLEIDEARGELAAPRPAATPARRTERLAWGSAVAVLAVLVVAIGVWAIRPAPARPEVRFDITTPPVSDPEDLASLAISPDGQTLAFVANSEGQPHLWVRPLNSIVSHPLAGTARSRLPFWSPDSRSVAFFADGQLKRIDLDGGLVRTINTQALYGFGGAWNRDGVILFVPNPASPIFRTSAAGGVPVSVTRLESSHAGHGLPSFLPDGRHFLYIVTGNAEARGVYVGQLDGSPPQRLIDADSVAVYASGHLLFDRQTTVFAQKFDVGRLEMEGSPFPVMEGVLRGTYLSALSAAVGGIVAVHVVPAPIDRRFVWVDRSGMEMEAVGSFGSNAAAITASPDVSHLAFFRRDAASSDIWLVETRRGVLSRFTTHPAEDIFPVWSRDGTRIVFSSNRDSNGGTALYEKRTSGNDSEELVLPATPEETFASDTSPDGQFLLYQRRSRKTGWDIWALPLHGEKKPRPLIQTEFDESAGLLSPDGTWLAYVANSSGRHEVYVQPFPGPGPRQQVSTTGGAQLRWRPDGRELFYIALDGKLMATPMSVAGDGGSLTVGIPVALFPTHIGRVLSPGPNAEYVVSADGKRFLMNIVALDANATPIRVIVNWKAGS